MMFVIFFSLYVIMACSMAMYFKNVRPKTIDNWTFWDCWTVGSMGPVGWLVVWLDLYNGRIR